MLGRVCSRHTGVQLFAVILHLHLLLLASIRCLCLEILAIVALPTLSS